MKVMVAYAPNDLRIVEMEKPVPGPRETLIKVHHTGICATDVAIMKGTLTLGEGNEPIYPVRLGHEWSGVVEAVGSENWRIKPGDRVISDTGYSCGECEMCLMGQYQNCENGRAIGTIRDCWPGAFAEYMLMPERLVFKVPDNVALDAAALIEPASIGLYGVERAGITPRKKLAVIGTGPIGLGGMACAKGQGIGKTILVGRKDVKLEIGRKLGADVLVNTTRESMIEVIMRETDGKGADIVLDTTGDANIFNDVCKCVRSSGCLVIPGFYEKPILNADLDNLIVRNCTLIGAAGTPNMGRKLLDLMSYGHVDLTPMITDRFPFSQVKEAFDAVSSRNDSRVKIMVDFV